MLLQCLSILVGKLFIFKIFIKFARVECIALMVSIILTIIFILKLKSVLLVVICVTINFTSKIFRCKGKHMNK